MFIDHDEIAAGELQHLANRAQELLRELLSFYTESFSSDILTADYGEGLRLLSMSCVNCTQSQFFLLLVNQVQDAEILARSILEGSLKFLYLLHDPARISERYIEYSQVLFDAARLKDHRQISELVALNMESNFPDFRPLRALLLTDEEVAEIENRWPAAIRRSVEQRWGVTRMLDHLMKSDELGSAQLVGLFRSYTLSSHVAHADYYGIQASWERLRRNAAEQEAQHVAHGARMICDSLAFAVLRLYALRRLTGNVTGVKDAWNMVQPVMSAAEEAIERFNAMIYRDDTVAKKPASGRSAV